MLNGIRTNYNNIKIKWVEWWQWLQKNKIMFLERLIIIITN